MKATLLLLVLLLSACSHLKPARKSPAGLAGSEMGHPMGRAFEEHVQRQQSPAIAQRAAGYEKQGHSPGEARAIAEIEYLRAGK